MMVIGRETRFFNNFEEGRGEQQDRVRLLTDVKNVTRMQSKLCQPVRHVPFHYFVAPPPSRRKFNSQPARKPFLLPFLLFPSSSLFLPPVNIMVARARGTPAVASLKMINLVKGKEPAPTSSMKNESGPSF